MTENIVVGSVIDGKVVRIKPFGAIVSIGDNATGLVHISQVSSSYVQDINDHIKVGDEVKVKVMSVEAENNRISLSIKEALPKEERPEKRHFNRSKDQRSNGDSYRGSYDTPQRESAPESDFEDKMKAWLKQANENQAGLNKRLNRR